MLQGRDPDTLPWSQDLSGPCPRCGRGSAFVINGSIDLRHEEVVDPTPQLRSQYPANHNPEIVVERAYGLSCYSCLAVTVVIEQREQGSEFSPVHWWPVPGLTQLDPAIPAQVVAALDEGVRCLSVQAWNAGVAMLRTALAEVVADKGGEAAATKVRRNLQDGLKAWAKEENGLHPELADWADHARVLGNAGAHQETYESVDPEQAKDLLRLVQRILDVTYVVPAAVARARAKGAGARRTLEP